MPSQHEVPDLTAAVLGIHKARSMELDTGQEKTLFHILEILCDLASGVQFSQSLLQMVERGPEDEFVEQSLSVIVLGAVRTTEILNGELNAEEKLHLADICYQALALNEELKPPTGTYISYYAQEMVHEVFPREAAVA